MGDERSSDPDVLAWRVATLESVEAAMRVELHDLREKAAMSADVYTKDAAKNTFVTRAELRAAGERRRQWPTTIAVVIGGAVALADLILQIVRS